jgi:hypothetical protein
MPDLLDSIRGELRTRVEELRPLAVEYERLQEAAQALGDGSTPRRAGTSRSERSGTPSTRGRRGRGNAARASTSAGREANREAILAVVGDRPGITKAELKGATGLSSAGVAQNLRRLLARGEVREEALPGGSVGFRLGGGDGAAEREPESVAVEGTGAPEQESAQALKPRRRRPKATRTRTARARKRDTDGARTAAPPDSDARGDDEDPAGRRRDEPPVER